MVTKYPSYLDKLSRVKNKLLRILQKKRTHYFVFFLYF